MTIRWSVLAGPRSAPSWSTAWETLQLSCLRGRASLAHAICGPQSPTIRPMPELPDLTVVAEAFHAALAGRGVLDASAPGPLAVRGTPAELGALAGRRLSRVARAGKFLRLDLDAGGVVINPMLT